MAFKPTVTTLAELRALPITTLSATTSMNGRLSMGNGGHHLVILSPRGALFTNMQTKKRRIVPGMERELINCLDSLGICDGKAMRELLKADEDRVADNRRAAFMLHDVSFMKRIGVPYTKKQLRVLEAMRAQHRKEKHEW